MKTILIATDFSEAARNASRYGIQLAKLTQSKIILFHSYHIPVPATEVPVLISFEGLEEDNLRVLAAEKKALDPTNELEIECLAIAGFAVDNIIETENLRSPDLIIMGMRGVGKLSEYLLGSNSTSLISRTATPILVVPEGAKFKTPMKLTFACDYVLDPTVDVLKPLKKFVEAFNSEIRILNFLKNKEVVNSEKAKVGILMENYLKDVAHSYFFEEDKDFVHGVIHFVEEHNTDIIAIIPHKHNLIQTLFKESHTKRLAFHTNIPLLTIPERKKAE